MAIWRVMVVVEDCMEVEADTQEEAEAQALADFDPTANDPYVIEAYQEGEDDEDE